MLFLLLAAAVVLVLVTRSTRADYGAAVALCPGPDSYGYVCESGKGYAYIDATTDTELYLDDSVTRVGLPFPFVFYGTTYTEAYLSSNGNMQFGNANAWYNNECLVNGPAGDMGDMIAPYWDDLDLRSDGYLETEVIGEMPNRIFVVEWDDVPRYGSDSEDRVTFEIQLFESSYDIVFLYEDVFTMEGYNGSRATIGLQSEAQGLALQYSCNQPAVADASGIYFPHPARPNRDLGMETVLFREHTRDDDIAVKGSAADFLALLNRQGASALSNLRSQLLNLDPRRTAQWQRLDLDGDTRPELVLIWRARDGQAQADQVLVVTRDDSGRFVLLLDERLSSRQESFRKTAFLEYADVTGDGRLDSLLVDDTTGQLFVITTAGGETALYALPGRCSGHLTLLDGDGDGRTDLIRDGCSTPGRLSVSWTGHAFEVSGGRDESR